MQLVTMLLTACKMMPVLHGHTWGSGTSPLQNSLSSSLSGVQLNSSSTLSRGLLRGGSFTSVWHIMS